MNLELIIKYIINNSPPTYSYVITKFSGNFFTRGDEGLILYSNSLVSCEVQVRSFAIDHEPVVAHHHALLEERLLGAPIAELLVSSGAHVIHLENQQIDTTQL